MSLPERGADGVPEADPPPTVAVHRYIRNDVLGWES